MFSFQIKVEGHIDKPQHIEWENLRLGSWPDDFLTPPKTNMEPESEPLEEDILFRNHHF